jgi:Initiator Replication protein
LGEGARHVWNEAHFAEAAAQSAPLPVWANFLQRALDIAIAEITKKTDISIGIESLARSKYRRVTSVTFTIEAHAVPNSGLKGKR